MNNYVVVKTRTIFFYFYILLRVIKTLLIYSVFANILFIFAHVSIRLYQGSNAYIDYLNDNALKIILIFTISSLFYIGFLAEHHIKLSFYFFTMPFIFAFTTYYLSFSFSMSYYLIFPSIMTGLFLITVIEKPVKKLSYKYKKLPIVNESFQTV